jgi:hypothetical protein
VVDFLQNDAIAIKSGPSFRNFTTILADAVVSRGKIPFSTVAVHRGFAGPGIVDYVGSKTYRWTVGAQGAVRSEMCARTGGGFEALSSDCTDHRVIHKNSSDHTYLGAVKISLLEDVPSASTECEIGIEISGACTACDAKAGEPPTGFVLSYGGTDRWGRALRSKGDWTMWALNDAVRSGQDVTAVVRPKAGGTQCASGTGCVCDGVSALELEVSELPGLHKHP